MSYPQVTKVLVGGVAGTLLEVSLILRCFGLCLVYVIIAGDMLAGSEGHPGLLCDVFGAFNWWCDSRPFAMAAVALLVFVPLVSFRWADGRVAPTCTAK
jgi:amino acid permease